MTSRQHAAWIARGSPWRIARPLGKIAEKLRGYGYTVYMLGNNAHLDHQPPERHCPYSETNWPAYQNRPMPDVVTADDIMPRTVGMANQGLPTLQQIGQQIFNDKQSGHPGASWVVGMNWGPSSDRTAVRDTWRPDHARSSSSDTGHIHLECRSDEIDSTAGDNYDPVARLRGQNEQTSEEDAMPFVAKDGNTGQYYICDMITSRPVSKSAVPDVLYLAQQLNYGHGDEGVEWTDGGWTRLGWSEAVFGTLQGKPAGTTTSTGTSTTAGGATKEDLFNVLESDRGQAAITHAMNVAEDS